MEGEEILSYFDSQSVCQIYYILKNGGGGGGNLERSELTGLSGRPSSLIANVAVFGIRYLGW